MDTPFGALPDRFLPAMSMADQHDYLRARMPRRRFLQTAAAAGGLLVAGPVLWKRPGYTAEAPAARHLTFGTDPRHDMHVSWSTTAPVQNAVVDVGLDTTYGLTVPAETRAVAGAATNYHHGHLTGLQPGTTYHYQVRHDGGASEDATFRTAPDGAAPFTFTAFGDQGVSAGAQSITARVAAVAPAFHIHAGDICYANNRGLGQPAELNAPDNNVWDVWLSQMTAVATSAPWMTAVGNHEMEGGYGPQGYDGYLARFSLPGGGPVPAVYAFRYGNVAVLSLDANDVSYEITANTGYTAGAQDSWLRSTLQSLRAAPGVDFIVAQFHHCAYCTNLVHASDGGVRDHWQAAFDELGVDLVVNGHNHSYERSHPMRGGAVTADAPSGAVVRPAEQGTTYVTAGGGGQVAYQVDATMFSLSYVTITGGARIPETAPWSAVRYLDLSFIALDVTPPGADGRTSMTLRAMKPDGTVVDGVTFERTRAVTPSAAKQPAVGAAGAQQGGTLAATGRGGVAAGLAAAGAAAAVRAAQRKIADR